MLVRKIIRSLKKKFPNHRVEFKQEQSRVKSDSPVLLSGVTRYQLILNEQPTELYLDEDEVMALGKKHSESRAEKIAVRAASKRIVELIKTQTNKH